MIVVESLINNVTYVVELSDVSTLSISQAIAAKNTSELVLEQVNNQLSVIETIQALVQDLRDQSEAFWASSGESASSALANKNATDVNLAQTLSALNSAVQLVFNSITTRPTQTPQFSIDFAGAQFFDPRLSCIRSGALATRVNRQGVIEVVPANTPRLNFDPVTGQCLGLLVEPTSQNRINPLVRSGFSILSATNADGRRNTPMGTTTHCFGITTTGNDGRIINLATFSATQRVCISIFLPKTSGNELISARAEILTSGSIIVSGSLHIFTFNQTTGQISNIFTGSNSGPASAILVEDYPTFGWWRLSVTFNVVVTASATYQIQLNPRTSANTQSPGLTLDYFGWSCEEVGVNGFGPSSYIHGQGTRGGEVIVLPSLISGQRGALAVELNRTTNRTFAGEIIGVQGQPTLSLLRLTNTPGTGAGTFRNIDGTNPNLDATGVNNNTNVIRAFLSYSTSGRRLVVDNSAVQVSPNYNPTSGVLTIGSQNPDLAGIMHIRKLAYWANPVPDSEMISWTQYTTFGSLNNQSPTNSDLGTAAKMDFNAIQRSPLRYPMEFLGNGAAAQRIFSLDFASTLQLVHLPAGGTYSVSAGTTVVPGTTVIPAGTNITVDFNVANNNVLILAFLPAIQ